MGDDLTFVVPVPPSTPTTATTTPAAAASAAPERSPSAGAVAPRCRRVHFPDLVASPIRLPPSPAAASVDAMAEEAPEPEKETRAAAGAELELEEEEHEDRMDLLWEHFNEELLAMRRAGGGPGSSCSESSSDGEESDSAAGRGVLPGCFPMLRPSARAGGAGHYGRRRAGSWVLLMRIFRRLFVVDKTVSLAAARRRAINSAR